MNRLALAYWRKSTALDVVSVEHLHPEPPSPGAGMAAASDDAQAARALIPQTGQQLATWARREYPHIFWLSDLLEEEYGHKTDWRRLLVDSGDIFRFDWPTSVGQPNCRPTLQGLRRAVECAGYAVAVGATGEHVLPDLPGADWAAKGSDVRVDVKRVQLQGVTPQSRAALPRPPEGYGALLEDDPELARKALVYLAISSEGVKRPAFEVLSDNLRKLLARVLVSSECAVSCDTCTGVAAAIEELLEQRQALLGRTVDSGVPGASPPRTQQETKQP